MEDLTEFRNYLKNKKRDFHTHMRGHEGLSFYLSIEPLKELKDLGVINQREVEQCLTIIAMHGTLFDSIDDEGNMRKPEKVFDKMVSSLKISKFLRNN